MKNVLICMPFILSAVLWCVFPGYTSAATELPQTFIEEDTVWTKSESPYILNGQIFVEVGVTLTIEPGVVVEHADGGLYVFGNVVAEGAIEESIEFVRSVSAGDSDVWGIFISENSVSSLSHVVISGAQTGIHLENAAVTFSSVTVNDSGGVWISGSNGTVDGLTLMNIDGPAITFGSSLFTVADLTVQNASGSGNGLEVYDSDASLNEATFVETGIIADGSTVSLRDVTVSNTVANAVVLYSSVFTADNLTVTDSWSSPALVLDNTSAEVQNSRFSNGVSAGISISSNASLSITDSVISEFATAPGINISGYLNATGLIITENGLGIYGSGEGSITNSEISNNAYIGMYVESTESFDARNNYWGDASGPYHETLNPDGLGDQVDGNVFFEPWSICAVDCFSNVLFLPGIKGSILKMDDLIGSETLWPPEPALWSDDVANLALNEDGTSVHDVFVDGILETFLTVSIYDGFVSFMDGMVADGTISDWEPYAYDWRLPLEQVVAEGVKTEDGVKDVVAEIEALAATSKSGKVTIIAHSMGGLLGKAVIKRLEDEGKSELIDTFVMVGSPQLGTPKAIGALLHGDDEGYPNFQNIFGIFNNTFLDAAISRTIARNMESSHTLLPSQAYFDEVVDPVVTFDTNSDSVEVWRARWGSTIDSFSELDDFLTGGDGRSAPDSEDMQSPAILREILLSGAFAFHAEYHNYVFPEHIEVVQLAGWGLPTVKSIHYTEFHDKLGYTVSFTDEGDGTVVHSSAVQNEWESVYVNLDMYNTMFSKGYKHPDLVSASPVLSVIENILTTGEIVFSDYVTKVKPSVTDESKKLLVSTHSPVVLGVYDLHGNYTGIDIENQAILEEIPGSSFQVFGHSQYVFVPEGGDYEFVYEGTGSGPTTVQIGEFSNDTLTPVLTFSDIPTTEQTIAEFTVETDDIEATVIELDTNGDSEFDQQVVPDERSGDTYSTPKELIAVLYARVEGVKSTSMLRKFLTSIKLYELLVRKFNHSFLNQILLHVGEEILKDIERQIEKERLKDEKSEKHRKNWWW